MMVETILESSQDFGMSNGSLPQWKRELLQRRAARVRPPAPAPSPPPPPPPPLPADEDDEELRYGPGIVKRLKSRYLSLALRDAPRRRPSVLRRAASLEHLLDERPPPAPRPARAPRPASLAAPPPHPRRDYVKRARSVDALSRLEEAPSPPPPAPRPLPARAPRPPRRPAPLLRDAERPPPDVVRSTLRKFESTPTRRAAPAARVSAVLRGLEAPAPHRSGSPEREPSPPSPPPLPATPPPPAPASSAPPPPALAASTPKAERSPSPVIEATPSPAPAPAPAVVAPKAASPALAPPPLPARPVSPVAPSPPRPAPAPASVATDPRPDHAPKEDEFGSTINSEETESGTVNTGGAAQSTRHVSRAALEGIARAGSSVRYAFEAARGGGGAGVGSHLPPLGTANPVLVARRVGVIRPMPAAPRSPPAPAAAPAAAPALALLTNGHRSPPPPKRPAWARAAPRPRAPPSQATSIVFNFSGRKEVPDYIENDGIVLRGSRRPKIKAGETGVVVLRGAGGAAPEDDSDSEGSCEADGAPASPLRVRFVNDNVLINGRSSMPARPDPQRQAKLKLQFDDSLTRTHEYPSETSLVLDDSPLAPVAPEKPASDAPPPAPTLVDNTHIASAALSRYAPSKTRAAAAPLGLAPQHAPLHAQAGADSAEAAAEAGAGAGAGEQWEAAPWSASRALATDLLF